jgi:hypothetical protein
MKNPHHLFATRAINLGGLEEAAADRVYRVKLISGVIYGLAAFKGNATSGKASSSARGSPMGDSLPPVTR